MKRSDLSLLVSRTHNPQPSVLSIYLNIDQSVSGNLSRSFETRFKKMASNVTRRLMTVAERERLAGALRHVSDFVSSYKPAAPALSIIFDTSDGFFWANELDFAVVEQARWGREPFLQPLINAADQLEGFGILLADRARFRLFAVMFGRIEEVAHEDHDARAVRHLKTAGTDYLTTSSRMQRRADNKVRVNLKSAATAMAQLAKDRKLHRFVIAGNTEIARELRLLLPTGLAKCVIGEMEVAMNTNPANVLAAARLCAEKHERESEVAKVNSVVTSAAKHGSAVVGLDRTLKAINSGRVWELIYSADCVSPGYECPTCAALFSARPARCTYCGARLEVVRDIVERAVEHALRKQARIEVVTGEASAALMTAGGIGALLRARTGTLRA